MIPQEPQVDHLRSCIISNNFIASAYIIQSAIGQNMFGVIVRDVLVLFHGTGYIAQLDLQNPPDHVANSHRFIIAGIAPKNVAIPGQSPSETPLSQADSQLPSE